MMRTGGRVVLACLLGAVAAPPGFASQGEARIRYAEPVELAGMPPLPVPGARKSAGSVETRLEAFGRRLDLQLESNDRVVDKLARAERGSLPAHALYRGAVAGLPGSWVRLTRLKDGWHGLVHDGRELLVIAPATSIEDRLDTPLGGRASDATVVYRAADAVSGLGAGFCRVVPPPGHRAEPGVAAVGPDYQQVFAELSTQAAAIAQALPGRELDLALVGDAQFRNQYANPTGEMLARLNNVDGIFSAQVGVKVVAGHVEVLVSNVGLTSTSPETLLDQFDAFRLASPQAASRGLAHLMTGRELDGPTVGIAYMGTLCWPQAAVSLSQTYSDTYYSSLIAAHELGHNFGAPHDGVGGSACAATPQAYLMAPTVSGSSTFSQCSLAQIAPVVTGAACLQPTQLADVAVEFAEDRISAYAMHDLHVRVDVVSTGNVSAGNAVLTVFPYGYVPVIGGSVEGASCSLTAGSLTCPLGSLAPGTRRTAEVVVRGQSLDGATLNARVTADADAEPDNDLDSVQIEMRTPADGTVALSTGSSSAYVGETQAFFVTARNEGPLALEGTEVVMQLPSSVTLLSAAGPGISCASSFGRVTCELGTLPAGESRRIDVSLVGTRATRGSLSVYVRSTNDVQNFNDGASLTITAAPLVELTVEATPAASTIMLGSSITQSFTLRSVGPQPVVDASVTLNVSAGMQIVSVTGVGATCALQSGGSYQCLYAAPIEAGGTRRVDAALKAVSGTSAAVGAAVWAPESQSVDYSRDRVTVNYQLRPDVDVALDALYDLIYGHDNVSRNLPIRVTSVGLTPATNVRMTVTLPAGVRATGANTTVGACSVTGGTVTCALGTLSPGPTVLLEMEVVADAVGGYPVEVRLDADADSNAANDAKTFTLQILPNVDVAVSPLPASTVVRLGATTDLSFAVKAATQPVNDVAATIDGFYGASLVAISASQGQCNALPATTSWQCRFGTVPANGAVQVTMQLRGELASRTSTYVAISGTGDREWSNNRTETAVEVRAPGNVALRPATSLASGKVGSTVTPPRLTLEATTAADDVQVALTVPSAFTVDSVTAQGAPCAINAGDVRCSFGNLPAGTVRGIDLKLRANQAGTFQVAAQASAAEDADPGDNASSLTVTVDEGRDAGGGSSGGGGGVNPAALLVLMLLAPTLARRRNRASANGLRSSCDRRGRRCAR